MIRLVRVANHFSKVLGDTIYAVATNHSKPSPINILRVSGPQSYKCLNILSKTPSIASLPSSSSKQQLIKKYNILPRYAHNATLYTQPQNLPIDKCLMIYFPEGKSYNGEDIFQFHLHGSPAILKLAISELNKLGFRLAEPGEFTKRAFINNKMDLMEVEGLHGLIHSENQFSRRIAMCHIMGETSEYLEKIKRDLISCLAACEAFIDFQQDQLDVKADLFDKTKLRARSIVEDIKSILSKRRQIEALSNGINLVIVGKPNAGKSTIMNKMAKEEVAIVSDEPGTTRDIVKTSFEYKGIQFNLSDTAGIRETQQKVEKEGIRRALEKMKTSHINLLVIDGSEEKIEQENERILVNVKDFADQNVFPAQKTIIVLNKTDLVHENLKRKEIVVSLKGVIRPVDISISALHSNIQQVMEQILSKVYNIEEHQDQIYLSRERHFQCLEECLFHLQEYLGSQRVDIASEELRLAIQQIGRVLGKVDCEDVLDVLFKDFCIGK